MHLRVVDFRKISQRLTDMRAQVFRRFEKGGDSLLCYPRFQRVEFLGAESSFDIARSHLMVFVDEKDQPRLCVQ